MWCLPHTRSSGGSDPCQTLVWSPQEQPTDVCSSHLNCQAIIYIKICVYVHQASIHGRVSPLAFLHDGKPQPLTHVQERHQPAPVLGHLYFEWHRLIGNECRKACAGHYPHHRLKHRCRDCQHVQTHRKQPKVDIIRHLQPVSGRH
jgi:hypothetical protein